MLLLLLLLLLHAAAAAAPAAAAAAIRVGVLVVGSSVWFAYPRDSSRRLNCW